MVWDILFGVAIIAWDVLPYIRVVPMMVPYQ